MQKNKFHTFLVILGLLLVQYNLFSQKIVQDYLPLKKDSLQIGIGKTDFLPFVQSGYTLQLPDNKEIVGVLIFLEDSKYDQKNLSAKQIYQHASATGFAVLSVSTEVPLDFYFLNSSMVLTHKIIKEVFAKHQLPNKNIYFLGASLVGHRAMRYIKFLNEGNFNFKPNIKGLVLCNFTMDFTRKWYQHKRDIRLNQIDLWEPKFINFMLETYLKGTPKSNPKAYHNFSSYSFFDEKNRNINLYKNYSIRVYIEPSIAYRLKKYNRTLYENNATDMVGFIAEQKNAGNKYTELVVLHPNDNLAKNKNAQSTWNAIDKSDLVKWLIKSNE